MVIFFDIDGTIVDEDTQIIPDSARQAIAALVEKGHTPIVNTGRPYSHIDPRVRAMPFAGWICSGGMEVRLDEKWLLQAHMEAALSRKVVEAVRQHDMQVIYEVEGGFVLDGEQSTIHRCTHESERMVEKGFTVRQIDHWPDATFIKFVTFDGPNSRHAEFVRTMQPHFQCIERGNGMVEYVQKGCSKAQGLQIMLDALDVPKEETFAFGDSTNDVPMFQVVGHPICMGNGMAEAKQVAEFVTDTVLSDGIANALRRYTLI